ncbi:MAG: Uma2 family endonuclease [Thermomicrobiales bacterium]
MVTRTEATVEDLYNAPDDGKYELVDGRLVYMSPTGLRPTRISQRICRALETYEEMTGHGMAIGDNLGFIVRQPRVRSFSPDAAYIANTLSETDDFVEGAPIFAVEVRSKGDYGPVSDAEYAAKRADYFAAGTQVVWDVSPRRQTVARYRADAPDEPRLFRANEIADAEPALPAWRIAVRDIFRT